MAVDDSHSPVMNSMSMIAGPKNEARLLREADCYMLASHFFWGLWAVVNAPVSSIPFGYWVSYLGVDFMIYLLTPVDLIPQEYAEARFAAYFEHKQYLLRKYGEIIEDIA